MQTAQKFVNKLRNRFMRGKTQRRTLIEGYWDHAREVTKRLYSSWKKAQKSEIQPSKLKHQNNFFRQP